MKNSVIYFSGRKVYNKGTCDVTAPMNRDADVTALGHHD